MSAECLFVDLQFTIFHLKFTIYDSQVRENVFGIMDLTIYLPAFNFQFLGPRGPHGIPSLVRPSVRPLVRKKKLDHIYTGLYAS